MTDHIVYPARGTGTTAGVRLPSSLWYALKSAAEAAGAPPTVGHYSPLDSAAFAKAGVKALAAALAPPSGVRWGRVSANVPMQAPTSPLADQVNLARVTAVIALFAQADGIVVESVTAAEHRANTR